MAFSFRGPQSPQDNAAFPGYSNNPLSPPRASNRRSVGTMSGLLSNATTSTTNETRAGLTRRFTTNALPALSPIGQQRRLAAGDTMQSGAFSSRVSPSEQKYRHYEQLLAEQRRIQAFIAEVDPDTRREVDDQMRHEDAVSQMIAQSEPTTPPEYADAFPSIFSKPNRYSSASLTSPPGIVNRPARASTQLTSPGFQYNRPFTSSGANLPSHSVPGSRRQSDDEEETDDYLYNFDASVHRAAANPNRNSMPVLSHGRKRSNLPDLSSVLGPVNTTSFLFDDEDRPIRPISKSTQVSPADGRAYLQVQHTADGFPKLIRREENGLSSFGNPSAALDLASGQSNGEQQATDRATASRHRISLPPSALRNNDINIAGIGSVLATQEKPNANNRRSVEFNLATEAKRPSLRASPPRGLTNGSNVSSYSTNDIPTLKSINVSSITSPLKSAIKPAQANAPSTSTIHENDAPAENTHVNGNGVSNGSDRTDRQHQEVTSPTQAASDQMNNHTDAQTGFQPSAQPFNPTFPNDQYQHSFGPGMPPYPPNFYGGGPYGMPGPMHMQGLVNGFGNMNMNGFHGHPQFPPFPQSPYGGFQQPYPQGPAVGGAPRAPNTQYNGNGQQRRQGGEDNLARFNNVNFEDLKPEILTLCTDQHGCRFLQRKLDEKDPNTLKMIFDEVHPSITKLMTDPFGNYLCQKLLENCDNEQRTVLIGNCMTNMTQIALNQHGTRALQKMIEFVSTPQQTQMIIDAMRYDVVQLIQDLNGNHVIQKCLNHLSSVDAQFIFDAVGQHCVVVGTHRHGCCVLQRCVDHASGLQKGELVRQISNHAFDLVQDPFGNYVVQYILDLEEPLFIEPLCHNFKGSVVYLSKQKFSSNVMEKCIRVASDESRRMLIQEITPPSELEKLLRDSFANYVVQTAFDYADDDQKHALANNLRSILPTIRHTPYGRRLQTKIQEFDGRVSGFTSGIVTPEESAITSPQQNFTAPFNNGNFQNARGNRHGFIGPQTYGQGNQNANGNKSNGANSDIASPKPQRMSGNLGDRLDAQSADVLKNLSSKNNHVAPTTNGNRQQPNRGPNYEHMHDVGYRAKFNSEQIAAGGRVQAHDNPYRYY